MKILKIRELWEQYRLYVIGVAVALSVATGLTMKLLEPPPATLADLSATSTPVADADIIVDVQGAVAQPGLRRLPAGSLVDDAIAAAGGLSPQADVVRAAKELNRADSLKDHQKIYVPLITDAASSAPSSSSASGSDQSIDDKININSADADELDKLPGVGPATAQKIIDYREENGPFGSIEAIKDVPGIGDAKFEQMKDQLTV